MPAIVRTFMARIDSHPTLTARAELESQRLDMIRKAAAEIAKLALQLGVPIAAEKLDFGRKRAELETVVGKKRADSRAYSTALMVEGTPS
ncbi:hypothetical protein ABIF66_000033 [Bradyrhizobium japonicum]|uniref:hypothetical protein n=1 Tax=Bradyrhizobium liaoningense TaxID=43992 RepID=UPI001BA66587|nr:hypothetical protein [Bradyrhizobium liaoningense]MBR1069419.1 hypothetical protein [Bradyrhizobium liaoningense]